MSIKKVIDRAEGKKKDEKKALKPEPTGKSAAVKTASTSKAPKNVENKNQDAVATKSTASKRKPAAAKPATAIKRKPAAAKSATASKPLTPDAAAKNQDAVATKPATIKRKPAAAKSAAASKPLTQDAVAKNQEAASTKTTAIKRKPAAGKSAPTSKRTDAKPAATKKPAATGKTAKKPATANKAAPAIKPPVRKPIINTSGKKKLVVNYKNLPPEVLEQLREKYPKGYSDALIKVDKGNGQFFYGVTLDTAEADYLIKVDVKIDSEPEEIERALFGGGEQNEQNDDEFPDDEGNFDHSDEDE